MANRNATHNGSITLENQVWYDCWIDNLLTGDHIVLPQTPAGFSESFTANYANQDIIGSSRPIVMYTGSSLRTISFSIQNLSRSYLPAKYNNLEQYVHMLQSLCFPEYTATGIVKAPDCHLQLGERSFRGVFTNVSVSWGDDVYNQNYTTKNNVSRSSYGINQDRVTSLHGGERLLCSSIEFSFTNTRVAGQIPGATWIRDKG